MKPKGGWTDSLLLAKNAMPRDTGRRGMPKPGCDCVQCFGYCDTDKVAEVRLRMENAAAARREREKVTP